MDWLWCVFKLVLGVLGFDIGTVRGALLGYASTELVSTSGQGVLASLRRVLTVLRLDRITFYTL
jgi:hypothetical protein